MVLATTADPAVRVRGPASAERLSVRILGEPLAPDEYEAAWRRLAHAARGPMVFQTADFIGQWARTFLRDRDDLRLILIQDGAAPVGLLPVQISARRWVTTARLAGAPIGQYDDVLIDPAFDPDRVIEAACAALRRQCGVDALLLTRVRADSTLGRARRRFVGLGPSELAPCAELGEGGADAFLATRKKRVREQLAKRRRQLSRIGPCEFAQASSAAEAADWMREALDCKRAWLARTGRISRAFADPRTVEFLVEAARAGAARPATPHRSRLVVSRFSVGGRTAAIEAGFVYGGTYYLYLGAFAPEFAKYGPGNLLTEAVVRACIDDGILRYDMLAPVSRNKREWANGGTTVTDLALPLSGRGRFFVLVVHRALLPAARRMFYLLPLRLRSFIAGKLLAP